MPKDVVEVRYIFDIYAVQEILNGASNQQKAALFDGLQNGSIKVLRSLSDELKSIDEDAYAGFQAGRPGRCYIKEQGKHHDYCSYLTEEFGGGYFRANPSEANFFIVAVCAQEGAALVAHGKAYTQCQRIINTCGIRDNPRLLNIIEFLNDMDLAA